MHILFDTINPLLVIYTEDVLNVYIYEENDIFPVALFLQVKNYNRGLAK